MGNIKPDYYMDVPVKDIVSESNRKHGGMGNIDILAESIKTDGLINPPTVVDNEDGTYRVIAGRRRIAAVRQLKWKEVLVRIIDEADADRLESIGLSENVNRQEMSPLDEAELFKRLLDKGTNVKDIAAYYDRSVSGIHHRIRLCNLQEEIKRMFREDLITLSGAALLASLPDEDQEKFVKKYGNKVSMNNWDKKVSVNNWEISDFIGQAQRFVIAWITDKQCDKCKNRTHNTEPGLFEDFGSLKDVCFDQDCYAGKWKKLLEGLIAKEDIARTEHTIILTKGIPNFLPRKTEAVTLGEVEYKLLPCQQYDCKKTSKKAKKNTAWLIAAPYGSTKAEVERVEYAVCERQGYGYSSPPSDPVKDFLIDEVSDVAIEDQKTAAKRVQEKYQSSWNLIWKVKETLLKDIITKRLSEENRENLAAEYLIATRSGQDAGGAWHEIDPDHADIFVAIFGTDSVAALFANFPDDTAEPLVHKLFLFLAATGIRKSDMPGLNDNEDQWAKAEKSLFWKFAQVAREEYTMMYREILSAVVRAAISEPVQKEAAPEETGDEDSGVDEEEAQEEEA
jgi:ParB/RepB/Spo0J family partition protein